MIDFWYNYIIRSNVMKSFKEINFNDIKEYRDPFNLFQETAVAVAKGKERSNAITIGWGALGTLFSKPCCTIYINKKRYSKIIFDEADTFSVCFFNNKYQDDINNYYGKVSGKDTDKMKDGPFTVNYIDNVPYFLEAEYIIICKMMAKSDFDVNKIYIERIKKWYMEDGVHTIYHGEVIKILKAIS